MMSTLHRVLAICFVLTVLDSGCTRPKSVRDAVSEGPNAPPHVASDNASDIAPGMESEDRFDVTSEGIDVIFDVACRSTIWTEGELTAFVADEAKSAKDLNHDSDAQD